MAASKRAPKRAVERSNSDRVPKSGGRATASKSVARRDPPARKAPQKRTPADQKPVSVVQSKLDTLVAMPTDRYPTVNPTVLASAFARAYNDDLWHRVSWDPTKQQWEVPSATDPRRSYRVWRRRGRRGPLPFYVALECNCIAEQSGTYIVCWHKCAVKLWLNEWFHNQALEVANDPPDA